MYILSLSTISIRVALWEPTMVMVTGTNLIGVRGSEHLQEVQ